MQHEIFISYSSSQKSIADGVLHYLEEHGYRCWMAPRDIPVGGAYGDLIESAIKAARVVVLVFSEEASMSQWVKGEVNVAFTEKKPILPFRVDDTQVSGGFRVMLSQMHWIDAFPRYSDRLPDLLESISGLLGKRAPVANPEPEPVPERAPMAKPVTEVVAPKEKKRNKGLWIGLGIALVAAIAALLFFVVLPDKTPTEEHSTEVASVFVNQDQTFTVKGVTFTMKPVEGGTFQMGNDEVDANKNEKPGHSVTVSSFYMGETEVTQALWKAVLGSNPSSCDGDELPVDSVSWYDCRDFIFALNSLTGKKFRLPTEAEWEYAARGGMKNNHFFYAGGSNIDHVAWHQGNSEGGSHQVKTKAPNELGIYDMSGNIWEWCDDWYGTYSADSQTDPSGPAGGSYRVLRGGGWNRDKDRCRVSYRGYYQPTAKHFSNGLRLVLTP